MQDLIGKAHINVLPSFNATGIKLKLVNALFNGRHCLVNEATAEGSGLESACFVAHDADEMMAWCTKAVASLNAAPKKLPAKATKRKAK